MVQQAGRHMHVRKQNLVGGSSCVCPDDLSHLAIVNLRYVGDRGIARRQSVQAELNQQRYSAAMAKRRIRTKRKSAQRLQRCSADIYGQRSVARASCKRAAACYRHQVWNAAAEEDAAKDDSEKMRATRVDHGNVRRCRLMTMRALRQTAEEGLA